MTTNQDSLEQFLSLSVHLTGFDKAELMGTGLVKEYYQQVVSAVGEAISHELWSIAQNLTKHTGAELDDRICVEIMGSPKFGPLARNIIQLWYWGSWIKLPQIWRNQYGSNPQEYETRFTSPAAYQEGLIWKAMFTHPQGAKQPGFGSWSKPPLDV